MESNIRLDFILLWTIYNNEYHLAIVLLEVYSGAIELVALVGWNYGIVKSWNYRIMELWDRAVEES